MEILRMGAGLYNVVVAFILAIFFARGIRSFLLIILGPNRGILRVIFRLLVGIAFLLLDWLYFLFTAPLLVWDRWAIGVAAATVIMVLLGVAFRHRRGQPHRSRGILGVMVSIIILLSLLLVATLTLMRAGFVALTGDHVTLLVDVTGETKPEFVRWAPPNKPLRGENLTAHHVIFWNPEGRPVGEVWMYGDEVAVKGRVLRLAPILNVIGIPNLYELLFAHNGYTTAERYNLLPHMALPLPLTGTLAVHPWLRPLQRRILDHWTRSKGSGSMWDIKAVSDESTYYPLIDSEGNPIHQTFLLVLTPGGLSSSRGSSPLEGQQSPKQ